MNAALLSTHWYRVADLRPRLASGTGVARQTARERVWHTLTDPGSGRQVRLNMPAWNFAGRCDGSRSVAEIWNLVLAQSGAAAPSQGDVVQLMAQLHAAGLIEFDTTPNLGALFARRDASRRRRRRAWVNPLIARVRLFDPGPLLERLLPRLAWLMRAPALAVWAACVAVATLLCLMHFAALRVEAARLFDAPRSMLLFWLCYPPLKAVHELAHGLVVRRFGGAVRDAGITLMFFTPAPYVDASAASTFPSRAERIAVSAAGIMAELFIAALAAMVWMAVEPGLVRDIAFVTLFIGGVSTLAVNGNPLMRFDGYYIATDALDLPNLALRSSAWWSAQLQRLLLGGNAMPDTVLARGERKWLILYAPLSLAWRAALMLTLVLWLGAKSWLLGAALGLGLAAWLIARPVAALARLASGALPSGLKRRALSIAGAATACAALFVFAIPLPSNVVAEGIVWPPERAQVRAESAGFVSSIEARHGDAVAPGQVLLKLREETLEAELERLQSQLAGHQARQYAALLHDPAQAVASAEDIVRTEAELARVERQLAGLEVRGRTAGRLVLPHADDLAGSFAARGSLIGYILAPGPANVRAALPESDALMLRERVESVEVRTAEARGQVLAAILERDMPAATRALPSAALGERAGGRFATDPADKDGTRSSEPVFLVDVAVPDLNQERIGSRVWVRFNLGREPLGTQALRRLRQLLLGHFNPEGQA